MAVTDVVGKTNFNEKVLASDKLVLVDFWAAWCGPCRMMSPILDNVAKKLADDVEIVKINIEDSDENRQLAIDYGVQGIPNMQVFKSGKVVDQLIGMRPQGTLEDELKAHI